MMGGWNSFGVLGWLPMLLFWVLLILGVVALVRYLGGTTRDSNKGRALAFSKSAMPKERNLFYHVRLLWRPNYFTHPTLLTW